MRAMDLDPVDRERITDCVLKIQSIQKSLEQVSADKIPNQAEITECLNTADHNLRVALGYARGNMPPGTPR